MPDSDLFANVLETDSVRPWDWPLVLFHQLDHLPRFKVVHYSLYVSLAGSRARRDTVR